jgi:hypothetical protein
MYRPEFHCAVCNRIYPVPMTPAVCPYDAARLVLEFRSVALPPEK